MVNSCKKKSIKKAVYNFFPCENSSSLVTYQPQVAKKNNCTEKGSQSHLTDLSWLIENKIFNPSPPTPFGKLRHIVKSIKDLGAANMKYM